MSAEFLSANKGLGFYIGLTGSFLDTARVMQGIVLFGIFGVVLGELLRVAREALRGLAPGAPPLAQLNALPPSTRNVWPVMKALSSDMRNAIVPTRSLGRSTR